MRSAHMNNEYKILTNKDIHALFKNAYQRYQALAVDYYEAYKDKINIPYSEKFIKLLTAVIILCNRFSINTSEQLYNIINLDNLDEAENYFSHIKAYVNKINHQLKKVEERGKSLREAYQWKFPSVFDKTQRVYVKINPILPEKLLIEEALSYLNFFGVENLALIAEEKTITQKGAQGVPTNYVINQYLIKRGKQLIKAGHFFQSLILQTEKLLFFFQSADENKDIQPFLTLLKEKDVKDIPPLLKKETTLPAGRVDLIILSYLKKTEAKNQDELLTALRMFFYRQKDILNQLQNMQTKNIPLNQTDKSIDTILFSINKRDLSTISTFTSWRSCMTVGGLYFDDVANQIGAGAIVAYGLNSQSPETRIARLVLKPYIPMETVRFQDELNEQKKQKKPSKSKPQTFLPDRIYIADQIFGLQNDRFKLVAESFAKDHLNTPNVSGAFFQAGPFHLSNLYIRYLIYDEKNEDNLIDYLNHNKIAYQTLEDGSLYLPRLSIKDTDQINLKNLTTDHLLVEGDLIARGGIKGVVSTYKLSVYHASNILKFPDNLSFHYLKIMDPKLTFLPQKISAPVLDITGTSVRSLPTFLNVKELIVKGTPIQSIPYLPTLKKLDISYSKNIRTITAPLQLDKLEAAYCENLTEISNDVVVQDLLDIRQTPIVKLPKNLSVHTINIYNCKNLTHLPKTARFQTLYASYSGLRELPDHLECNTLLLNDTAIERIPANLKAKKVNLTHTFVKSIPTDLKVQELYLDSTKVQVVPPHLKVQKLSLFNCDVQTIHYSKHLKAIYLSRPVLYIHPKINPNIIEGIRIEDVKKAQKNYVLRYQKNKESVPLNTI